MNKAIIIFALLIAAFAYVEANRCRSSCRKNIRSPIRCVRQGSLCRKITQCSIDAENCRRRLTKQPRLTTTSLALCRNIKGRLGSGRCAIRKRRPRSLKPRCNRLNCPSGSTKLNCYSDKQNRCQLLTPCQLARANCRRDQRNLLEWVDLRRCAGMRAGQKLRKCRPGPRRS
ncbi:uncharacterized protein LOC124418662 [Lucilia cuprina]|uniref:uncharacterized protein LOC124418662 n=1 Tax=Lucilia cuprina TaxID=7375 RepID=UPI001F06C22B|nr:uncharacterized protein LOC124418662 [Lucilia cuprina]